MCESSHDPLVALWRTAGRPLNWRVWQPLSTAEQARVRFVLMTELCLYAGESAACPAWIWTHVHREVLELKAASGKGQGT